MGRLSAIALAGFIAGCECSLPSGIDASSVDAQVAMDASVLDAPSDAAMDASSTPSDGGLLVCGAPLGAPPADPRPSSMHACAGCDYDEGCDFTVFDLLCPAPPCGGTQTGDERCHRICDDARCAAGERCEARPVYVSDTPTRYLDLCVCEVPGTCAEEDPAPEGGLELWSAEPPMTIDLYYHAAVATERALYVSGGLTILELMPTSATLERSARVLRAELDAEGHVTGWSDVEPLPEATIQHGMAVLGDRLYVAGGDIGGTFTAAVRSAPIAGDGTLGAWRDEADLPAPRAWHTLLADGSRLLLLGGSLSQPFFTDGTDRLWIAEPDSGGAISSWTEVRAPAALHYDAAPAGGERIYAVDEAGSLRSWPELASWRLEVAPRWDVPFGASGRHTIRLVELCDALIVLLPGGVAATAPIAGGILGEWRASSRVIDTGTGFAAVSNSRRAYVLGGTSNTGIARNPRVWSTARR